MQNYMEPPPAKRRKAEHVPAEMFAVQNKPTSAPQQQNILEKPVYLGGNRRSKLPVPSSDVISKIKTEAFRQFTRQIAQNITHVDVKDPKPASKFDLPPDLPGPMRQALLALGFQQLFSHQLELRRMLSQGKDVIITTPTSSGKSIAFNVPVFERILKAPQQTSALYLFPLNALVYDQVEKMKQLNSKLPPDSQIRIVVLTGETEMNARRLAFAEGIPHIVVTSPDLLHFMLARYKDDTMKNWREFLARLKVVVMDEAHQFVGVFGTNVSNLVRRLYLILHQIGKDLPNRLRFIIASATVGNATELAERIMSRKAPLRLSWIKESGAATHERVTLCLAAESNPKLAAAKIIDMIVSRGMNGIVFVNTIDSAWRLLEFMQTFKLKDAQTPLFLQSARASRVYFASRSPQKKQEILQDFKSNRARIVVTTNALEAGVDFPDLQVCVIKGYPGSRMSFLQRVGRAGRGCPGMIVFIPHARSGSDFYYAEHPQVLHDTSKIENVAFNPNYPILLKRHVLSSIYEIGGHIEKSKLDLFFGIDLQPVLDELVSERRLVLVNAASKIYTMPRGDKSSPLQEISLRGGDAIVYDAPGGNNLSVPQLRSDKIKAVESVKMLKLPNSSWKNVLYDPNTMKFVENVPKAQSLRRLFPGAIFKSSTRDNRILSFECQHLDLTNGVAYLRSVDRNDQCAREDRMPIVEASVRRVSSAIMPTRDRWFQLGDEQDALMHVTISWAKVEERTVGYEARLKQKITDENLAAKAKSRDVKYENPYFNEYEAPAVRFSLSTLAIEFLNTRVAALYSSLMQNADHQKSVQLNPEQDNQIKAISLHGGAFVVLHTFLHQLMAVAPMMILTSSLSDLQEVGPDPANCSGYIVDSVPGGNGASEQLFERFDEFVAVAKNWASACTSCDLNQRTAWGCALCLYQAGGRCVFQSTGLIASLGASLLNLKAVSGPTRSVSMGGVAGAAAATSTSFNGQDSNGGAAGSNESDNNDSIVDRSSSNSSALPRAPVVVPPRPPILKGGGQVLPAARPAPTSTMAIAQKVVPPAPAKQPIIASTPPVIPATPEHQPRAPLQQLPPPRPNPSPQQPHHPQAPKPPPAAVSQSANDDHIFEIEVTNSSFSVCDDYEFYRSGTDWTSF